MRDHAGAVLDILADPTFLGIAVARQRLNRLPVRRSFPYWGVCFSVSSVVKDRWTNIALSWYLFPTRISLFL
jgi:hypothetical protein